MGENGRKHTQHRHKRVTSADARPVTRSPTRESTHSLLVGYILTMSSHLAELARERRRQVVADAQLVGFLRVWRSLQGGILSSQLFQSGFGTLGRFSGRRQNSVQLKKKMNKAIYMTERYKRQ